MRWPWRRDRGHHADSVPPDDPVSQPGLIFTALDAAGVEYVVIGGIAVQAHGHARTTRDVDVVANPTPDNLRRLAGALDGLEARLLGVDAHLLGIDPANPRDLAAGANFTLSTQAGRLDVWTDPAELKGSPGWEQLRGRALEIDLGGQRPLPVAGLDDLLSMKRAANRQRDREDVAALTGALDPELVIDPELDSLGPPDDSSRGS